MTYMLYAIIIAGLLLLGWLYLREVLMKTGRLRGRRRRRSKRDLL